jgi:hypothetical protein
VKETLVLTRVHFSDEVFLWPFQIFTPGWGDPQVAARIHLKATVARITKLGVDPL